MVFSSSSSNIVRFISKYGVQLFQIVKDKTGSCTYDTVYIKDNNTIAASSGYGDTNCIAIIDIESKSHDNYNIRTARGKYHSTIWK
jgi:protein involved in ribonucleotide reduction